MNEKLIAIDKRDLDVAHEAENNSPEEEYKTAFGPLKKLMVSVALSLLYSLIIGIIFFGSHGFGYAMFTTSEFLFLPLIPAYIVGFLIYRNIKKVLLSKIMISYWQIYYLIAVWWISQWRLYPHPPVQVVVFQETISFILFLQLPYLLYAFLLFYHFDMKKYMVYLSVATLGSIFFGWVLSYGWWLNWY